MCVQDLDYKAYLAKAAFSNQINDMVVFHGHTSQCHNFAGFDMKQQKLSVR